jgi:hypothetical protein
MAAKQQSHTSSEGVIELSHIEELDREGQWVDVKIDKRKTKKTKSRLPSLAGLYARGRRLVFWFTVSPSQDCKCPSTCLHKVISQRGFRFSRRILLLVAMSGICRREEFWFPVILP